MISNSEITKQARESLKGKWGLAIGVCVIQTLIMLGLRAIPNAGSLLSMIIGGPIALGIVIFSLSISRGQQSNLDQLFFGFKRFGTSVATYLLVLVFTILWTLLLIVPGLIASYSYSMAFFILADDPTVGAKEAIKRSKKMMYGHKWGYFFLSLRFIGWCLLSILTLGIGLLWVIPYMWVAQAKFYESIKDGEVTPSVA